MSEKLCAVEKHGGGGGSMTETTLWTNPNPTSGFASQNITLSDNISNYDYIAINIRIGNAAEYWTDIFPASEMTGYTSGSNTRPLLGARHSNNYYYYRMLQYNSDTSLTIGDCVRNTANGTAAVLNSGVLPQTIKGLK